MWQRWNQSTHIFEKSTDNGSSWSPLGLNASIITEGVMDPARLPPVTPLPANIAYTHVNNYFVPQTLQSGNIINGANMLTTYVDPGAPAGAKVWRTLQYQGTDAIRFECLSDDQTAVTKTPLMISRGGGLLTQGGIDLNGLGHPIGTWVDYAATWASSGVQPAIGNGGLRGRYTRVDRTIWFIWEMASGSTTVFGSGYYYFNVPKDFQAAYVGYLFPVFHGMLTDVSIDKAVPLTAGISNVNQGHMRGVTGDYVTSSIPVILQAGDTIRLMGCYQTI
jgi:hypothetical protein